MSGQARIESGQERVYPLPVRLVANRKINEGEKETRHFEISIAGSDLKYQAGDALGVLPSNCPDLVAQIIRKLGSDGEEAVVPSSSLKTSLRAGLQHDCEIHRIPATLLKPALITLDRPVNIRLTLPQLLCPPLHR